MTHCFTYQISIILYAVNQGCVSAHVFTTGICLQIKRREPMRQFSRLSESIAL